jgi:tetratricopeptide (TPR) repeat protein
VRAAGRRFRARDRGQRSAGGSLLAALREGAPRALRREALGKSYSEFRDEFDRHIVYVDAEDAALPWDRLGHWAQDEGDWVEAERCFRKAYDLEGAHYGYCLGTALSFLGQYEESLSLLLEQARVHQPDAMSWFQVASAYASLSRWPEAIDAYERAVALDPDYALAIFDLGGAHWNSGDVATAVEVWTAAVERFPDDELSAKLKREFSLLFAGDDDRLAAAGGSGNGEFQLRPGDESGA